jgi:hypothetical protein
MICIERGPKCRASCKKACCKELCITVGSNIERVLDMFKKSNLDLSSGIVIVWMEKL